MSDPEQPDPVPTGGEPTPPEEEAPVTETPKAKRPLSEERLKQLAKAREKAAATHARKREEKLRAKVAALPPEAPEVMEPKHAKAEPPPPQQEPSPVREARIEPHSAVIRNKTCATVATI